MLLKDQVALVTGGSRGIGRAIVQALAARGPRSPSSIAAASKRPRRWWRRSRPADRQAIQADVAEPGAAQRVVEEVVGDWGRIDILVNNAGVIRDGLFVRMEPDDWKTVLDTNLGGTFTFCRAVAGQMALKQRSGRIINMSSVAAEHVNAGQTNYAASKGAINAFTRALAVELGSRNVTVNASRPRLHRDRHERGGPQQGGRLHQKKLIPMRRLGKPEDIAAVVVFLASAGRGVHHRPGDHGGRRPEPRRGVGVMNPRSASG